MQNLFISYLSVEDIINLCHVSRIYRQLISKKFGQIYYMSTGFCSAEQWFLVTWKICLNLVEEIFNQRFFDETLFNYHFDFDENYLELQKNTDIYLCFLFVCIF